jgi:hypothetical protein
VFPLFAIIATLLFVPAGDPPGADLLAAKQAKVERMDALVAAKDAKLAASGFEFTDWVMLLSEWQVGDRRDVEIIQGTRTFDASGVIDLDSTRTVYRAVITEAGHDFYRTRWYVEEYESTEDVDEDDFDLSPAEILRLESDGMLIRTDGVGQFLELENQSLFQGVLSKVIEQLAAEADPDEAEQVIEAIERLGGVDWMVARFLEPILFFYGFHGNDYVVDREIPIQSALSLGQSGHTIPVTGTMRVSDVDYEAGTFVITRTQEADPAALARATQFLMGADEMPEPDTIRMTDRERVLVDEFGGWVLEFDRVRTVREGELLEEHFTHIRSSTP